ncbi:outer membrane usher protein FimD [Escherichia coli]|uniref:Outer membrane usher protein FimD n=1 Tax=Escherichia coli TaxID=562 RepID=A0A2I5SPW9_ECOLX|nr:adhesin [Escherichia coli]ELC40050.1 hypothetical protein WE9_02776 [Escherichia coli KTE21]EOU66502.1 hypothetical protein WE7_02731 [Escherichia coli KTE20]EQO23222.1 hypothetical protein G708_01901 [Escherichia coli HVH 32 (4-3773988)]ESP28954.1 hypothetical protein G806_03594 [Escherichia coli HVH 148 (4-3192490)]ESP36927.1 hypothetical protein G832_00040 [Escherichia coli HVH 178 (4-3189163)]ETY58223.1 hypothetical protein P811_00630 [Escherichia coli BIDMC 49b]ETY60538.1 hypothetica
MSTWVTITEAVEITTKAIKQKITPSDIYRHALSGNILLSVYFQSPVILKKIQTFNGKIKFRQFVGDLLDKLCMLDRDGFIYGQNLRLCTEARYICPVQQIIDTPLLRKLNQFRTFVRNVRPGDELDVPAQVSEKNLTPPPGNSSGNLEQQIVNRPGFPGECFICELRLPDHRFRWKHNKLFLLLPEEYGPAFPAIVDCYTSPPT